MDHGEEPFIVHVALPRRSDLELTVANERRRWARVNVSWRVEFPGHLCRNSSQSTTSNISPGGFYCLSRHPHAPGERMDCILSIPAYEPARPIAVLCLQAQVELVRVESTLGKDWFGTACRILGYRVLGRRLGS